MGKISGSEYPPKRVLEHQRYLRRFDLFDHVAHYIGQSCVVLSFAMPLWMVYRCVDALAGRTTAFDVKLGLTLGVAVGGSGLTAFVAWLKDRRQRKELVRLRERIASLEARLGIREEVGND